MHVYGLTNQSRTIQINDKSLTSDIIFKGLEFPTSMAFLGNDDILILEKNSGTVKRITNGKIRDDPLIDLNVANMGERGLLGIAISKSNQKNNHLAQTYVFLYLTESPQKDGLDRERQFPVSDRIYRFDLSDNNTRLVNKKLMIELASSMGIWHHGGKLVIGPDNNLYFTIGDLSDYQHSKVTNVNNSVPPDGRAGILRITENGNEVKDNFTLGNKNPLNKYFAYGIRNSFGLDFDPVTEFLWDSEVGPAFGDEINLVRPGFNSGWSLIQGFWKPIKTPNEYVRGNYTLVPEGLVFFNDKNTYSPPELTQVNHNAFTSIKFLDSDKLGLKYKNTLFVGEFNTGKLYNFKLTKNRTSLALNGNETKDKIANSDEELKPFQFAEGFGGIVDIQVGPDGYLYVLSLYHGGGDCDNQPNEDCYYSLRTPGTIFKIKPIGSKS